MGPMGVNGLAVGGGPAYWVRSVRRLGGRETDLELKLGAILNTIQSSLSLTYTSRTHTDTPHS